MPPLSEEHGALDLVEHGTSLLPTLGLGLSRLLPSPVPGLLAVVRMDAEGGAGRGLLLANVVRTVPRERPDHAGAHHAEPRSSPPARNLPIERL